MVDLPLASWCVFSFIIACFCWQYLEHLRKWNSIDARTLLIKLVDMLRRITRWSWLEGQLKIWSLGKSFSIFRLDKFTSTVTGRILIIVLPIAEQHILIWILYGILHVLIKVGRCETLLPKSHARPWYLLKINWFLSVFHILSETNFCCLP